ncbi:Putative nitrite/Sulfite reductase ferredoxin-like domain, nitrite/sulphite reductase 4Fe-4S [Colletotrichum destructivum]|uniref:Nitrite reductase [NAD(P)H] n=1 Tax=Colletotrichum destructivum TaxID=34406 RepID=A0AAX4ILI9_9PEZI|nr:Putative nitrite/Sulfite reductase ferredoxin-like domain, nitrite/sulphite reductase 4Fe-4S [Colletotrichum destructivum]
MAERKRLVVVGLGMVGIAFIEKMLKLDARANEYTITVLGEEPHLAYNRVGLTSFFDHRKVENLYLNPEEWYHSTPQGSLGYHVNTKVTDIDSQSKTVTCSNGEVVPYDILVIATGSDAVLPKHTPGHDAKGVFVYRTIDDLINLIAFAAQRKGTVGAVVGGGLLGLEAAKAMMDLDCFDKVKLIERNRWVLSRQLDNDAGSMVVDQVRDLGLDVLLSKRVGQIEVTPDNHVQGVVFEDGERMDCSTICFAIGVRPRDELARRAGIKCADRGGGIVVADDLSTSIPDIYAIGECASWQSQTFGLIAPGVEMADVLSFNLTQAKLHQPRAFKRPDLSTKLKLLGVDVASFGDFFADRDGPQYLPPKAARKAKKGDEQSTLETLTNGLPPAPVKALTYRDPFQNVYKKYIFTEDGKYLLGGMMIGDTKDYIKLVPIVKNMKELDMPPSQLILGAKKDGEDEGDDLTDDTQICSCHNVTKGDVVNSVKDGTCKTIGEVKSCTKAGTGCGGCMPLVTTIFNKTMLSMGNEVKNYLCAHFNYSRADLYNIVLVKRLQTLEEVMREAGNDPTSLGCEACKPTIGSIFASLWNRHVMDKPMHGLQETNDRFLGNIQRNGTYSVVPRVSAGEITPDKLIAIGNVASKYNLYTKITGGQRIDMFGAKKQDLLDIWRMLVEAGMESGHAYAKSLRTVKSCVGTTWCRYGVGDSVGMAVRLEERYKSIRAPHKIKGGVSGCVRECAEAQNKDFGLIATETGFNIFVAGNGGAKPKHSELLAKDVPPTEVIPIIDRYLMFYIRTADKLQRTARWLENLPGGIKYLQEVVLEDKLGICASLEAQMQELVDSFFDEWAEAIKNPAIAAKFKQFDNTDETVENMEVELDRDQARPVYWAPDSVKEDFKGLRERWSSTSWQPMLQASHFFGADETPNGISATVKRGDTQLAVWRIRGRYYATQQMCPHKRQFVLSDGLIGEDLGADTCDDAKKPDSGCSTNGGDAKRSAPWISCPYHKRNFDLANGDCKNDAEVSIATFPVEERADGMIYLRLPPVEELDAALGTAKWMVRKGESGGSPFEQLDKKIKFKGLRAKKPGVRPMAPLKMQKPAQLLVGGGGGCGSAPDW